MCIQICSIHNDPHKKKLDNSQTFIVIMNINKREELGKSPQFDITNNFLHTNERIVGL